MKTIIIFITLFIVMQVSTTFAQFEQDEKTAENHCLKNPINLFNNKQASKFNSEVTHYQFTNLLISSCTGALNSVKSTRSSIEEIFYFWVSPPFPNPARNSVSTTVFWDWGEDINKADIMVYNYLGDCVSTKENILINTLASYKANITWDCSKAVSGVYFIFIQFGDRTRSIPVVVQR